MIKFLRTKKKLTQDDLGVILGVKKSAIQKYESGAVQNLKMETLKQLCEYFNVPPVVFTHPARINDPENAMGFFSDLNSYQQYRMINLNERGRQRLKDYIDDLLKIEEYQSKKSR